MNAIKLIENQLQSIFRETHYVTVNENDESHMYCCSLKLADVKNIDKVTVVPIGRVALKLEPWKLLTKILVSLTIRIEGNLPRTIRERIAKTVISLYTSTDHKDITREVKRCIVTRDVFYLNGTLNRKSIRDNDPALVTTYSIGSKTLKGSGCAFMDMTIPREQFKLPPENDIVLYANEYNKTLIIEQYQSERLDGYIENAREKITNKVSIFSRLKDDREIKYWEGMSARITGDTDIDARFPTGYRFQRIDNEDKGKLNGSCNVNACQSPIDVVHYNKAMRAHYCTRCMKDISKNNPELFETKLKSEQLHLS